MGSEMCIRDRVVTIIGACGLRVLWIYTVFPLDRTFFTLFLSYPITWGVTAAVHAVCYFFTKRTMLRRAQASAPSEASST